jgi:hypothetical protein
LEKFLLDFTPNKSTEHQLIKNTDNLSLLYFNISFSLHGNNIGDAGMKKIAKILLQHPSIICLDVGDCNLGDESVEAICNLLPPHGKKTGKL